MYEKLEITSNVLKCYEHNNEIYVVLDNSPFYPEGGGQKCDLGKIGEATVLDVFKHDGEIVHKVDQKVVGEVLCSVDESIRLRHSLLHSAQHLLSAVFERGGYDTTSFAMKDDHFTIDITSKVSREVIDQYENEINELIRKGIKIYTRMYDRSLDSELDVSYLGVDDSEVRLVIIEDLDKNPCGGTHIDNTNKIEYLKIIRYKYSGEKTRIDVLIGSDAISYVNKCFNEYTEIVKLVNQTNIDTYTYIENKLKEGKKNSKKLEKLEKRSLNEK